MIPAGSFPLEDWDLKVRTTIFVNPDSFDENIFRFQLSPSKHRLISDEGTLNDLPYESNIHRSRKVKEDSENCDIHNLADFWMCWTFRGLDNPPRKIRFNMISGLGLRSIPVSVFHIVVWSYLEAISRFLSFQRISRTEVMFPGFDRGYIPRLCIACSFVSRWTTNA